MFNLNYYLNEIWNEIGDKRVTNYYLMDGGPLKIILILLIYLIIVKYVGPKFMENRSPFNLRSIILIYNSLLIGLNGIGFIFASYLTDGFIKTIQCSSIDQTNTFRNKILILFGYFYFISKFADLFDTLFFVLRKKKTHITILHVFHHSVMPLVAWFGLKMHPSHYTAFLPVVNAFVHTLMYTYYALSCSGIEFKQLCSKWKIYLTRLQILQFILLFFHSLNALIRSDCNWPTWLAILEMLHSLIFLFMFTIFYKKTYLKKFDKVCQMFIESEASDRCLADLSN